MQQRMIRYADGYLNFSGSAAAHVSTRTTANSVGDQDKNMQDHFACVGPAAACMLAAGFGSCLLNDPFLLTKRNMFKLCGTHSMWLFLHRAPSQVHFYLPVYVLGTRTEHKYNSVDKDVCV